ncbi:hypothetical protein Q2T41_19990 [Maribacter confluentis]|uniref:Uncharacterized protein n=1 Tax=Maribacter confluentis TaxID=1656093 RepID=A0ABT8RVF0_9FLAO|nr:hypothetical protein [Maribacter confluentis]MDO1514897.1 hypothetical protein [Maribacter confluentis]
MPHPLCSACQWFGNLLKGLSSTKPLIITGDFNVAHTANDLANPKAITIKHLVYPSGNRRI